MAITLIDDAVIAGARCVKACEIIGHSTIVMTMRYAHLAPDHLTEALTLNPSASFDTLSTSNS